MNTAIRRRQHGDFCAPETVPHTSRVQADGTLRLCACQDGLPDGVWKPKVEAVLRALYAHAKRAFLAKSVGVRQVEIMRGIKVSDDLMRWWIAEAIFRPHTEPAGSRSSVTATE